MNTTSTSDWYVWNLHEVLTEANTLQIPLHLFILFMLAVRLVLTSFARLKKTFVWLHDFRGKTTLFPSLPNHLMRFSHTGFI